LGAFCKEKLQNLPDGVNECYGNFLGENFNLKWNGNSLCEVLESEYTLGGFRLLRKFRQIILLLPLEIPEIINQTFWSKWKRVFSAAGQS